MKAVGVESKANKRRWWFMPQEDLQDPLPMDVDGAKILLFKGKLGKIKDEGSIEDC